MKTISYYQLRLLILLLGIGLVPGLNALSAQEEVISQDFLLSGFSEVEISGAWDVELEPGADYQVRVEVSEALQERVDVSVDGNRLVAKMKKGGNRWFTGSKRGSQVMKIYVSAPSFRRVDLSGACDLSSAAAIETDEFFLNISGASDVRLQLKVNELNIKGTGASDITLEGTAEKMAAVIKGSTDLSATELSVLHASVKISGASGTSLTVHENLLAEASGASSVVYNGNPVLLHSTSGSSMVRQN